jgi:hypothetical protein
MGHKSTSPSGPCLTVLSCDDINKAICEPQNRECPAGQDPNQDSICGECISNFYEVDGVCERIPTAPSCEDLVEGIDNEEIGDGVIAWIDYCLQDRRVCEVINGESQCTGCIEGYTFDPDSNQCREVIPCNILGCDEYNRSCEEENSIACGQCEEGYTDDVQNPPYCRSLITCENLNCGELGTFCVPHTETSDAYCEVNCGPRAIWNGFQCTPCPPCQGEGEDGVSRRPTEAGYCVCNTQEGYFYSTSADIGTFRCDADNDGWLRENARLAKESNDPVLQAQAKCTLRKINAIELINEAGEWFKIEINPPIPLYETLRNDDQNFLEGVWSTQGYSTFENGHQIQASSLNRFTKMCHALDTDYNDNGVPDFNEWTDVPLSPSMKSTQKIFNEYSYFVELNRGHFEIDSTVIQSSQTTRQEIGKYVIQERSRTTPNDYYGGIQITSYNDSDHTAWRTCSLENDRGWEQGQTPLGLDLNSHKSESFSGMKLHSLFKCLYVTSAPDEDVPTHRTPNQLSGRDNLLNLCEANRIGNTGVGAVNSTLMSFECNHVPVDNAEGKVVWSIEPYKRYIQPQFYKRGCMNSCIGYDCGDEEITSDEDSYTLCISNDQNFGDFMGCYAWEICDGLDNDNDGRVDEQLQNTFTECTTGLIGVCGGGTNLCLPDLNPELGLSYVPYKEYCVMNEQLKGIDPSITTPLEYCSSRSDTECVHRGIKLGFSIPDLDGDTIPNLYDNCPNVPNESQIDTDIDGLGDECDLENQDSKTYENAVRVILISADSDHDGVLDNEDNCPQHYNPNQTDFDEDQLGDRCDTDNTSDIDNDGVNNTSDVCPFNYSSYQVDGDGDGDGNQCDPDAQRPLDELPQVVLSVNPDIAAFISPEVISPEVNPSSALGRGNETKILKEYCNGIDDDCDGRIDEWPIYDNPNDSVVNQLNGQQLITSNGEGTYCRVASTDDIEVKGICVHGNYACHQGELFCEPKYDIGRILDISGRSAERDDVDHDGVPDSCDGADNDCDGQIDEPNEDDKFRRDQGSCSPEYRQYYFDKDEDGYGNKNFFSCACNAEKARNYMNDKGRNYFIESSISPPQSNDQLNFEGGDCCDSSDLVHPRQTLYFTDPVPESCNFTGVTHDYNCDLLDENEGLPVDMSDPNERLQVINELIVGGRVWVYDDATFTQLNHTCENFIYDIRRWPSQYVLDNDGIPSTTLPIPNPGECVRMWRRAAPSSCGESNEQVEYYLFNEILYYLPILARFKRQKCR